MNPTLACETFRWFDFEKLDGEQLDRAADILGLDEGQRLRVERQTGRPGIEEMGQATFFVLYFPTFNDAQTEVETLPVEILLADGIFVSIRDERLHGGCGVRQRAKDGIFGSRTRVEQIVYELLVGILQDRFDFIDTLRDKVRELEQCVFVEEGRTDMIRDLMVVKKHVSTVQRIVEPQRDVVRALGNRLANAPGSDPSLMRDIEERLDHITTLLRGLRDSAEIITEANEAFLNHSLNNTLRVLTVVSVILIPPTLISGIFGMNVGVPWQDHPYGFAFVSALIVGAAAIAVLYFKRRGWY